MLKFLGALAFALLPLAARTQNAVFATLTERAPPVAPGAREPSLFTLPDGALR